MKRVGKMENDAELRALMDLRDEDIDTSDIPERTDWYNAVRGKFYRPVKEPVTIRLDADVVAWLKSEGPGYQTRLNSLLRAWMIGKISPQNHRMTEGAREVRFPSLEKQGQMPRSVRLATCIQRRRSVFAPVA